MLFFTKSHDKENGLRILVLNKIENTVRKEDILFLKSWHLINGMRNIPI